MPTRFLAQYAANLPILEAEQSFLWAERFAIGGGTLKDQDRTRVIASWRSALKRAAQRPRTPEELEGMARAVGIGFRRVPKRAVPDPEATNAPV